MGDFSSFENPSQFEWVLNVCKQWDKQYPYRENYIHTTTTDGEEHIEILDCDLNQYLMDGGDVL
jgi:hypothetical protein